MLCSFLVLLLLVLLLLLLFLCLCQIVVRSSPSLGIQVQILHPTRLQKTYGWSLTVSSSGSREKEKEMLLFVFRIFKSMQMLCGVRSKRGRRFEGEKRIACATQFSKLFHLSTSSLEKPLLLTQPR